MTEISIQHATAKYAAKFPGMLFVTLPTGETVSRGGFGSYRVAAGVGEHEQALRAALRSGINLIDTSTNYALGESERLVGEIVGKLEQTGELEPGAAFIVTKAGYIQGGLLEEAQHGEREGKPIPGVVKYADGVWHSIHPLFLKDQLHRSLERLNRLHVNVLLLHNPEYYLAWARNSGIGLVEARAEFYRRIKRAFEYCEKAVAQGKISWYGVSSNTFGYLPEHQQFCSLEECARIADEIAGGEHHFRFAQMPLNLLETGAASSKNSNDATMTVLEFAEKSDIAVLINRPFNALTEDGALLRLTTENVGGKTVGAIDAAELAGRVEQHERRFINEIAGGLNLAHDSLLHLKINLTAGVGTAAVLHAKPTGDAWSAMLKEQFEPRAIAAITRLREFDNETVALWINEYIQLLEKSWNAVSQQYPAGMNIFAKIEAIAQQTFGESFTGLPLTQISLRALIHTGGVSAVLVGARREEYIPDVTQALEKSNTMISSDDWRSYIREMTQE